MASIALLTHQYREALGKVRPGTNPLDEWRGRPGLALAELLEREGVPLAQAYCDSPAFRRLALWPLVKLLPGCETAERRLIESLQQELIAACQLVQEFIFEHRELLDKHFPAAVRRWRILRSPPPLPPCEGVEVVDDSPPAASPSIEEALSKLEGIQARCTMEWVSANDYFGPHHDVWVNVGETQVQRWEYVVAYNPQLQYVGNYIARCLLVRAMQAVEALQTCAQELRVTTVAAQVRLDVPYGVLIQQIGQRLESLRQACLHAREAQLAEAAMSVVQIAVGFARNAPHLDWLPVEATQFAQPGTLEWALDSRRDFKTAQVIQESLDLLKNWDAHRDPNESLREDAIATGGLVLFVSTREVFWQGQLVPGKWKACHRQWELLLALAKSRGLGTVSLRELYGDKVVGDTAFTQAKIKLGMMLPESLRKLVKATRTHGQLHYQLCLASQSIHILER